MADDPTTPKKPFSFDAVGDVTVKRPQGITPLINSQVDTLTGKPKPSVSFDGVGDVTAKRTVAENSREAPDAPGFFDAVGATGHHAFNLVNNLGLMANAAVGVNQDDPNAVKGREMLQMYRQANTDPALKEYHDAAIKRLKQTFSFAGAHDIWNSVHQGVGGVWSNKGAMVGGLADAFVVQPIKDFAQASIGATVGEDVVQLMTPEQRAKSMTNTVANVAILGAGAGLKAVTGLGATARAAKLAGMAADANIGSREILAAKAVTDARIAALASGSKLVGAIKRGAIVAGEGTALGATYGAISGAGDEDQVAQMVAGMLTFATLGTATHAVFGEGYTKLMNKEQALAGRQAGLAAERLATELAAKRAGALGNLRQLQYSDGRTVANTVRVLDATIDADGVADAAANGLLELDVQPERRGVAPEQPVDAPKTNVVMLDKGAGVMHNGQFGNIVRPSVGGKVAIRIEGETKMRFVDQADLEAVPVPQQTLAEQLDAQVNFPNKLLDTPILPEGVKRKVSMEWSDVEGKYVAYDIDSGRRVGASPAPERTTVTQDPAAPQIRPTTVEGGPAIVSKPAELKGSLEITPQDLADHANERTKLEQDLLDAQNLREFQNEKSPSIDADNNAKVAAAMKALQDHAAEGERLRNATTPRQRNGLYLPENGEKLNVEPVTPLEAVKVNEHVETGPKQDAFNELPQPDIYPVDTTPNADAVRTLLEHDVDADAKPVVLDNLDPRQAKWLGTAGYVTTGREGGEVLVTRSQLSKNAKHLYDDTGIYKGKEMMHAGEPVVVTGVDPVITVKGASNERRAYASELTERPAPPQAEFTPPELPAADATAAGSEGVTQPPRPGEPDSFESAKPAPRAAQPPVEPLHNPLLLHDLSDTSLGKLRRAGYDVAKRVLNGSIEYLASKTRMSDAVKSLFEKHGLAPDQVVIDGRNGREVTVLRESGDRVTVRDNATGHEFDIPSNELARPTDYTKFNTPRTPDAKAVYDGMFKKLLERIPDVLPETKSIGSYIREFLNDMGVQGNPDVFLQEMHDRLAEKIEAGLEPSEKSALDYFVDKMKASFADWKQENSSAHDRLVDHAVANNIFVEVDGNGNYKLRDASDGKEIQTFTNAAEAADWLRRTGVAPAIDLLNGMGVDVIPSSPKMNKLGNGNTVKTIEKDYMLPEPTRLAKVFAAGNNAIKYITGSQSYFKNLDIILRDSIDPAHQAAWEKQQKMLEQGRTVKGKMIGEPKKGTRFFQRHDESQVMFMKGYAEMSPFVNALMKLRQETGKLTTDQIENIGRAVETMSPEEVIKKGFAREMTDMEISLAKWMHENNIDITKTRKWQKASSSIYVKQIADRKARAAELNGQFKRAADAGTPIDGAAQEAQMKTELDVIDNEAKEKIDFIREDMGISPLDEMAVRQYIDVERMDKDEMMLGPVFRLREAYRGGLTRPEFMAANAFTPQMERAVYRLDYMYQQLADKFGIDPKQRIAGFMSHKQVWIDGNIEKRTSYRGTKPQEAEFYAKLSRVGDITNYEKDPFIALSKYMRAGFLDSAVKHLEASREIWYKDLKKIADPDSREVTRRVIDDYIDGLKGIPAPSTKNSELMFEQLKKDLKLNTDITLKDLVNVGLNTSGLGTLGFRESVGIRDALGTIKQTYVFFGTKFTGEALNKSKSFELARELERTGQIKEQSTINSFTQNENEGDLIGRGVGLAQAGLNKVGNVGMKVSGAKFAYRQLHAGIYQAMYERVASVAKRVEAGDIKKVSEAYDHVMLSKFDVPTQKEFISKFESGNYEEAARFLARNADNAVVVQYGLANAPYGWRTLRGRVMGQFGSYPVWYLGYLQRLMANGTWMDKGQMAIRIGIAGAALKAAEDGLGIDLSSLHMLHPLTYSGGIAVGTVGTIKDAMGAGGPIKQKAAYAEMMSFLPVSPVTYTQDGEKYWDGDWKAHINHAWLPGSSAVDGWARALQLSKDGHNPFTVGLTGIGFQAKKDKPAWLDNMLGYRPMDTIEP